MTGARITARDLAKLCTNLAECRVKLDSQLDRGVIHEKTVSDAATLMRGAVIILQQLIPDDVVVPDVVVPKVSHE